MNAAPETKIELLILRHGPTAWNRDKRLQGRTDIAVDLAALKQQWPRPLPSDWHNRQWLRSPLTRARQTAEYFQLQSTAEPAFIEMNWGDWEGRRLSELRVEQPEELERIERLGLHLRPPKGESPFDVQQRLSLWAQQQLGAGEDAQPFAVISHKGVIRALLAAATDWDMKGKPPVRLDFNCAHRFCWAEGRWSLLAPNLTW